MNKPPVYSEDGVLNHPSFGHCEKDNSKITVCWINEPSDFDKNLILERSDLVAIQNPNRNNEGSRDLIEINHTSTLGWYESQDGKTIENSVIENLEKESSIMWVTQVFHSEKSKNFEGFFCVNPSVLYVRKTHVLGDVRVIDPSLSVNSKRTSAMHGLTVLDVENVSISKKTNSLFCANSIYSKLEKMTDNDVIFENIPMIKPTCDCSTNTTVMCSPSVSEVMPNDPLFPTEWGMRRINASRAWNLTQGIPDVVVAVLDEGVELSHPDLDVHPLSWNATTHTPNGGPVGNHGTACAGIVAGKIDNSVGVAGVAGKCRIMAIATSTWADTDIAEGIYFAADNGARVISMSFGVYPSWGSWNFAIIQDALQYAYDKGLVLVAASGNENISESRFPGSDSRTICVGGSNRNDVRKQVGDTSSESWWGACYGNDLDVVAPCLEIPTTDRLGGLGYSNTDYYDRFNGTSSATPHVAGLAALILSIKFDLTNEEVRKIIEETCDKISPATYTYTTVANKTHGTWNSEVGYGRVNAERAVLAACNLGIRKTTSTPCDVELPCIPNACQSPPPPPWKNFDQCIYWYETKFVSEREFLFRITYQHCLKLRGRQQGPLLFTTTLLPGEKQKLFHYERYRSVRSSKDSYTVHTSLRQYVSAIQQSKSIQSASSFQDFLVNVRAKSDADISIGGGLLPVSWDDTKDSSTSIENYRSANSQSVMESFSQTIHIASQQVDAERSIVVSSNEEKDQSDATAREIENKNDCMAVTYFVRRVYECFDLLTSVLSVDWRFLKQRDFISENQWRDIEDTQGMSGNQIKILHNLMQLLPKQGEIAKDAIPVSIPTDGVVYEAELAHCSSCEPEKIVESNLRLAKLKGEERKICLESELLNLEVKRREMLLNKGVLESFETPLHEVESIT